MKLNLFDLKKQIKTFGHFVFVIFYFLILGCEGGIPEFSELDSNKIPAPTIGNKLVHTVTVNSVSQVISIQGECDSRIKSLEAMVSQYSNWLPVSELSSSSEVIDCQKTSTGSFLLSLKSISQLGYWGTTPDKFDFTIELRSQTPAGPSSPMIVKVLYRPEASIKNSPNFKISNGSQISNSSLHVLKGTISFQNNILSSSPKHTIIGGVNN